MAMTALLAMRRMGRSPVARRRRAGGEGMGVEGTWVGNVRGVENPTFGGADFAYQTRFRRIAKCPPLWQIPGRREKTATLVRQTSVDSAPLGDAGLGLPG